MNRTLAHKAGLITVIRLLFVLALGWASFGAQLNRGATEGTITDSQGAAVPEAGATVVYVETGVSQVLKKNAVGYYPTEGLLPGPYQNGRPAALANQGFGFLEFGCLLDEGISYQGEQVIRFSLGCVQRTQALAVSFSQQRFLSTAGSRRHRRAGPSGGLLVWPDYQYCNGPTHHGLRIELPLVIESGTYGG